MATITHQRGVLHGRDELTNLSDAKEAQKRIKTNSNTMLKCAMDVDTTHLFPKSSPVPSNDEVLVAMVESNDYSYDQVVQFCIESGIPLSRMLRLDLMRITSTAQR